MAASPVPSSPVPSYPVPGTLVPSMLDPQTQAFPALTQAQIDRIRPYGKMRQVKAGEIVFEPDASERFLLRAAFRQDGSRAAGYGWRRAPRREARHPGDFTGEVTMISGRRSLVRGRVTEPGEFIEVSPDNLRSLLAKDAEISEILMRAFILRRLLLINQRAGEHCSAGFGPLGEHAEDSRVSYQGFASLHVCGSGHGQNLAGTSRPLSREA